MKRYGLRDDQFARIETLLPGRPGTVGRSKRAVCKDWVVEVAAPVATQKHLGGLLRLRQVSTCAVPAELRAMRLQRRKFNVNCSPSPSAPAQPLPSAGFDLWLAHVRAIPRQ
jgi:hypothetical protein